MIFVTTGSTTPFDRLVEMCDLLAGEGVFDEPVFAQIGHSNYLPRHMTWERLMNRDSYDSQVAKSTLIIGHAGIGTISQALQHNRRLIVVARRKHLGESVNDHQVDAATYFSRRQHVLAADDVTSLKFAVSSARHFKPLNRSVDTQGLAQHIGDILRCLQHHESH